MNIAFFGTSDRSMPILDTLNKHFNLALCVTKEDVKVGRHQKLKETGVKLWAKSNRVQFLTTRSLSPIETSKLIEQLIDSDISIGVVCDYSFIIPEEIINTPKYKLINIHFSLLPKYRGASPVQHAIINGNAETGVSYQIVAKKMDTGPIIHQVKHPIKNSATSETLYKELFEIAAKNLPRVIKNYVEGEIEPRKQNESEATYTYSKTHPKSTRIFKEDAKIDWNDPTETIERKIRAYIPWPIAWTTLGEIPEVAVRKGKNPHLKVKIYEAKLENGGLKIEELQVEGSKKIDWKDFENGYLETSSEAVAA